MIWEHDLYEPEGHEGLKACRTCGGAEGSLPQECPQREMSAKEQDAVYNGELEFLLCGWWVRDPEHKA